MQTQRYETVLHRFQEGFRKFTRTCHEAQLLMSKRNDAVRNHTLLHQGLDATEEDPACYRGNQPLTHMGVKGIEHQAQLLALLNESPGLTRPSK